MCGKLAARNEGTLCRFETGTAVKFYSSQTESVLGGEKESGNNTDPIESDDSVLPVSRGTHQRYNNTSLVIASGGYRVHAASVYTLRLALLTGCHPEINPMVLSCRTQQKNTTFVGLPLQLFHSLCSLCLVSPGSVLFDYPTRDGLTC